MPRSVHLHRNLDKGLIIKTFSLVLVLILASSCASLMKPKAVTRGDQIAQIALKQIGRPYRYGGASPRGFDCSGLTYYVYGKFGCDLPRTTGDQIKCGRKVSRGKLQPGDLVFFKMDWKGSLHTGIYVGDGKFVHAPSSGKRVEIQRLDSGYFKDKYKTARRVIPR